MTGPEIVANLQEEPAGKPWESDYVRDWEPAPFDRAEYDKWAKEAFGKTPVFIDIILYGRVGRGRTYWSGPIHPIDPLLRRPHVRPS